ncbi:ribbon-helix-helix domain-containing protein [Haloarcula sp. CBA1127]|uniref:ribbon-helix-helix domain-containing protein n=1 Tax=Haloarcula sp. CBA1127 TaxID=1765055 RepID=UPI000A938284|nr:ribbon-helix-helix domain-containing protein [Haloarcula sp. CBA1127]
MAKQLSVRIDDELEEMISEEVEAHPYEPSESDIVRTALREYLQGNANSAQVAKAD